MYKIAHDKAQAGRDRLTMADIVHSGMPEVQSWQERRQNLVRAAQRLELEIKCEIDKKRRKELGLQRLLVQNELAVLKKEPKKPPMRDYPHFFVDAARATLPREMFVAIYNTSLDAWEADHGVPSKRKRLTE